MGSIIVQRQDQDQAHIKPTCTRETSIIYPFLFVQHIRFGRPPIRLVILYKAAPLAPFVGECSIMKGVAIVIWVECTEATSVVKYFDRDRVLLEIATFVELR
jgi:hypothetical protein